MSIKNQASTVESLYIFTTYFYHVCHPHCMEVFLH